MFKLTNHLDTCTHHEHPIETERWEWSPTRTRGAVGDVSGRLALVDKTFNSNNTRQGSKQQAESVFLV